LQFLQVDLEPVEALLPKPTIIFEPVVDALESLNLQPARPPLRLAPARDKSGPLQYLEMFLDGREAHLARLGQL
jgi:hypothetical protein